MTDHAQYDAFFSYAGEDERAAAEIVGALKMSGFRVWYAPDSLEPGQRLLASIEEGMRNSRSGIILLTRSYFAKGWPKHELEHLYRKYIEENHLLVPIWMGVTKAEVESFMPSLSGIVAIRSGEQLSSLLNDLIRVLSKSAPRVGVVPPYESPVWRFLQGRGEITIGADGPATTLWEYLLHGRPDWFPLYLEGRVYQRNDLLFRAAELITRLPTNEIENWVGKAGRQAVWDMCVAAGMDPRKYE